MAGAAGGDDAYRAALMDNLGASADEAAVLNPKKVKLVRGAKIEKPRAGDPGSEELVFLDDSEEARRKREDDDLSKGTAEFYASTQGGGYGAYRQYGKMDYVDEDVKATEEVDQLRMSLEQMVGAAGNKGTGSDVRSLAECPKALEEKARYLSPSEVAYCEHAPDPPASTAGRIAAKHAISRALRVADESLFKDLEVMASSTGAPSVLLSGLARAAADALDVTDVKVTISHSGKYAIAAAAAV